MKSRSTRIAICAGALALAACRTDAVDRCFNETAYLKKNPEVAEALAQGRITSARAHWEQYGRFEGKLGCTSADFVATPKPFYRILIGLCAFGFVVLLARRRRWGSTGTAVGLSLVIALFGYLDYVSGRKAFIFRDVASDTLYQFWPMMRHVSKMIWSGQAPMFSFHVGLGENVFPGWVGDPFALVAILSGASLMPWMIGVLQVAKILVATGFMAGYFKLHGYTRNACIVGALSVGFCGHMISRGIWYEYATEVAVVSLYLFAFERFVRTRRFALLAVATGLLGFGGAYFAWLWGVLLLAFACVRIFYLPGGSLFGSRRDVLLRYLAASLVGVLLAGLTVVPDLLATLASSRMTGKDEVMSSYWRTSVFAHEGLRSLLTLAARTLSPNLLGNAANYSGPGNYLDSPMVYAGLLGLLCLGPCFAFCSRRQRIVLGAFAVVAFSYHYFVFLRLAFNAFSGAYFKLSSAWIAFGLAMCAAHVIDGIEKGGKVPARLFAASLAVVLLLLGCVDLESAKHSMVVARGALWGAVALVFAYAFVFLGRQTGKPWGRRTAAVVCLMAIEFAGTLHHTLNVDRSSVDGFFPEQSSRYSDLAAEVIRRVRDQDPGIYRIERDGGSVFFNDALMQDYLGTREFLSFTSRPYVDFLKSLQLLNLGRDRPDVWIDGIGPHALLMPVFGLKYYLSHSGSAPAGYQKDFTFDGLTVFRNDHAGSLGHFYEHTIAREDLLKIETPLEMSAVLLGAAAVETPLAGLPRWSREEAMARIADDFAECRDQESCIVAESLRGAMAAYDDGAVRISGLGHNAIEGSVTANAAGVLFVSVPFHEGWSLWVDGRPAEIVRVNLGFLGARIGPGQHSFVFRFRTPGIVAGGLMTLTGLVALLAAVIASAIWRRRAASPRAAAPSS